MNSQTVNGNTKISSNKIIINLEDIYINEKKPEDDNKTDEISTSANEITIKIDEEKENKIIDDNFENMNKCNIYGGEKLIKPILVW